jgi:tetratricopeptide (TPR) repeat protein
VTSWKVGRVSFTLGSGAVTAPSPRDAQADSALLVRITETARGGDIEAATGLAETALAGGLEHPLLLNLVAGRREAEGRHEDALRLLQRAHALSPQDVGVRHALGLCLVRLERYPEGLAQFDAVVAAQPAFAPGHGARGMTLEALGDIRGAGAAYSRALELQPGNLVALAGAASLASRRGAHAEARVLAEQVLKSAPGYPDAVMTLASAELAQGKPAAAEARLRELIIDPRATPQQQALAEGLLGDILDAQGQAEAAFVAYRGCNGRLLELYRDQFGAGQSPLAYVRELIEVVRQAPSAGWTARPEPPASGASGHVFLMGFFRSGTTLLEQVLASHPAVEALEERETLIDAVQAHARRPQDLIRFAAAPDADLTALRQAYWDRVAAEGGRPAGKLFVDKQPLNVFKLPLIARLFPDAKVLFARRDPRDVVLSCFRRRFAMNGPTYQMLTLQGTADYYDTAMQLGERIGRDFPLAQLIVRQEGLVEDFDAVAREVCAFLGLEWTDAMRDFAARTRDRGIATPSGAQLAGGLSAEGVGHWRWYAKPMAVVMPTLQPWVDRFGYPST